MTAAEPTKKNNALSNFIVNNIFSFHFFLDWRAGEPLLLYYFLDWRAGEPASHFFYITSLTDEPASHFFYITSLTDEPPSRRATSFIQLPWLTSRRAAEPLLLYNFLDWRAAEPASQKNNAFKIGPAFCSCSIRPHLFPAIRPAWHVLGNWKGETLRIQTDYLAAILKDPWDLGPLNVPNRVGNWVGTWHPWRAGQAQGEQKCRITTNKLTMVDSYLPRFTSSHGQNVVDSRGAADGHVEKI